MAAFPTLVETITVPVTTLAPEAVEAAGLDEDTTYAVIEPAGEGVAVRAATMDEELAYERAHGLTHISYSLEEFLADLDSAN